MRRLPDLSLKTWMVLPALMLAAVSAFSQTITPLQADFRPDMSYYDIAQVGPDAFWVAGENNVLTQVDSSGNLMKVDIPFAATSILKIVPTGSAIFLACDQGTIYRFDLSDQSWSKSYFSKAFAKLAFYDMLELPDGTLLASGGNMKIAKGKKGMAKGFIAKINPDLKTEPEVIWKNPVTFVWSLLYHESENEILAASYNGGFTQILSSVDDGITFQRKETVKALVHHLALIDGDIWYSGAKDFRYTKDGIIGKMGEEPLLMEGEGCIWSLLPMNGTVYSLAYNGALVAPSENGGYSFKVRPVTHALYEGLAISSTKALIAGHGQALLLMDLGEAKGNQLTLRVKNKDDSK